MPQLKVIRASAGSGKTYTLTGEYLRLLFDEPDYFRHILAVTFTNKATNEMKERIVRELDRLSSGKDSKQIVDLMNKTGHSEIILRKKAGIVLKKMLHQYSGFSINTIDSFFQIIIRSFTRELGLQGTYSIELDTDSLLIAVIDQLLVEAETDKPLLNWLGNYAESLIEKGDSWNFRKSIRTLGKEIFSEEFKSLSDKVSGQYSDRSYLKDYQRELYTSLRLLEKQYRDFGLQGKRILDNAGLIPDDFSGKSRGPAGFLLKMSDGELFKEPNITAQQAAINPEKWVIKNSPKAAMITALAEQELMPLMSRAIDFYMSNHRHYFTLDVVLKNIYTLGILSDLSRLAYRWCNENNVFLLPEAPVFLQKIIDGNDTPFIYEKAGYWYHNFMIDEFQDTSLLQWLNFKPLISNSLSQGYDNLVVGDAKQSIYRWRNSNWMILAHGLEKDFPAGTISSRSLNQNWRSGKNIIDFNNRFFHKAALLLEKEFFDILQKDGFPSDKFTASPIARIYSDTIQEPGLENIPEGEIQISFLTGDDENSFYDHANRKLVNLIHSLMDKGYSQGDIAIITRKNKEAKILAEFLLGSSNEGLRFDVISDEALRLGSSSVVTFIISLLQYIVDPDNQISSYLIVSFYKNKLLNHSTEWELPENNPVDRKAEFIRLIPEEFMDLVKSAGSLSLAEITERMIAIFHLSQFVGEQVYLNAFRDLVQEYGQKYAAEPRKFIDYWNETGRERSVSAPSHQDALRILTVHKSKGLEFKIVIIPYCQWELNEAHNSILWCKTTDIPFNKLGIVPVHYSSRLKKTLFTDEYYTELLNQYIDNLNLLYVSFTRACDGLYVFCSKGKEEMLKNVSNLTERILSTASGGETSGSSVGIFPGIFDHSVSGYSYGILYGKDKEPAHRGHILSPASVSVQLASGRIQIGYQGQIYLDPTINIPKRPLNEGKILHEIFKMIRTRDDVVPAVTGVFLHGKINRNEKDMIISHITHTMNDIQVMSWFTSDWHIFTEAEIILPKGVSRRPDRVMTKDGLALVIDYKTGAALDPSHKTQVKEYMELLRKMGYARVEGYLWYVMQGRVVLVGENDMLEKGNRK